MSSGQGRNFGERVSRANTFAIGQVLAQKNLARAMEGDIAARRFLMHFGRGIKKPLQTILNRKHFLEDEINEIGAAFVERVQGTYDERMLPAFAQGVGGGGILQPFFALSRWSIEKSNVIWQDVISPVVNEPSNPENIKKLLFYVAGASLGGEAISAISEFISSRRPQTPGLLETHKSKYSDTFEYVQALASNMQLAGVAGIAGDMMRAPIEGLAGNMPQGFSYPTLEFMKESVVKNVIDMEHAIGMGEPVFDSIMIFAQRLATENVQSARLIGNLMNKDETASRNRARDLRLFNQQTDRPFQQLGSFSGNPFLNQASREFKKNQDPTKVGENAIAAIKDAVSKSGDNLPELERRLKGLKIMSKDSIPNPDTDLPAFIEFVDYVKDTQGEEVLKELMKFWQGNKILNQLKKSLIPSLSSS